ncbi:MAG: hypothetical protein R2708_18015 [Vicinamibacterales bacterium]
MLVLALERTWFDRAFDRDTATRVWREVRDDLPDAGRDATSAQLTIVRNAPHDFRDRQVYLWVDGDPWGKIRYGVPVTAEIPPGPHRIRVNNTLFNDTLEFTAAPGEHVRIRCTNGMPRSGWVMLVLLHVTYLSVRLEREA